MPVSLLGQLNGDANEIESVMENMIKTEGQSILGNFKFTASDVEACRICLATDVKLHSLQDTRLGNCMKSIAGFTTSSVGDLPNYVCYECAPILLKSAKLIEKSKTAEATLLDIFEKNGQITKNLIKELNRSQLKLQSSFDSYLLQNYYYIKYDDDNSTSQFIPTESVPNIKMETTNPDVENKVKTEIKIKKEDSDDDSVEEIKVENPLIEVESSDGETTEDFISLASHSLNGKLKKCNKGISSKFHRSPKKKKTLKRKQRENSDSDMWSEFIDIQQYFTVNKIPLSEQITAWRLSMGLECSVCQKSFPDADSLQAHFDSHSTSIRGEDRCEVCLVFFSTRAALEYHTETIHANRFCCKCCPMVLGNIDDARYHKNVVCVGSIDHRGPTMYTPPMGALWVHQPTPSYLPPRMRNQQNWRQRN